MYGASLRDVRGVAFTLERDAKRRPPLVTSAVCMRGH
jgi:hypothetical protein